MNNKFKGISKIAMSNLLALGAIANPVSVFAESGNELVKTRDDGYGFVYKKNAKSEVSDKDAIYGLRLSTGLSTTGRGFVPTEDQIKEGSVVFKGGTDQRRVNVNYDGVYDLYQLQREPGLLPIFPFVEDYDNGEGLEEDVRPMAPVPEFLEDSALSLVDATKGFEFPGKDGDIVKTQDVRLKEHEFLNKLQVILQNEYRFGLRGTFDFKKIANPDEVYGRLTEEELQEAFGKSADEVDGYNAPSSDDEKNKVKSWKLIPEKDMGTIETKKKADYIIEHYGLEEEEKYFASDIREDITEGIYVLEQKTTEVGYNKRPVVAFAVTLDNRGYADIEFLKSADSIDELYDEFDKIHENEQFRVEAMTENDEPNPGEIDSPSLDMFYQALLVNYPVPGFKPVDPTNPEDPDNPLNPETEDPITPEFFKNIKRQASLNDDYKEYEDAVSKEDEGSHIKVNIGEVFDFVFDLYIPSDIAEYKMLEFQDFFHDAVNITNVNIDSLEVYDEKGEVIPGAIKNIRKTGQDLRAEFDISKLEDQADKSIRIVIGDVFLKEKTIENIPNRGYVHYEVKDNKTPNVPDGEKPKDPDVINPEDPTKPFNPEDPNDPGTVDPENPPTIPTTPEVIVDPINVDFRMGVVDQGTNILDDAEYRIVDFVPSRGDGKINEDGNIQVGEVVYDIHKEIDAGEGFVKLENLPAGKYTMEETVAPVKGDKDYRLVTDRLVFVVHEDEKHVTIESPIVKNGEELTGKLIDAETLYREEPGSTVRNEENWNNPEVNDKEAMLHHYRYINTPETGTLAHIPFLVGGGVAVTAGITVGRKKKEDEEK